MDHDVIFYFFTFYSAELCWYTFLRIEDSPSRGALNGYAYGKGLHFANAFAISEGYSCGTPEKLMLLCKSAIERLGTLAFINRELTGTDHVLILVNMILALVLSQSISKILIIKC